MNVLATASLLACLSSSTPDVPGFGADVTVGQVPPPLLLEKLLQAPAGATATSVMAGPAVVEFWATWCQPCVEQIPHFNELHHAMEGRPLRFLSVTAEDEDKVTAFLREHPMRGVVGLEGKKAHNWGVRLLPTSILIDAQGRVAAILQPYELNPSLLQRLVDGQPLDPDISVDAHGEDALLRTALWRASDDDDEDFEASVHHLRARRAPLKTLVAFAHGVEPWQVQLGKGVSDATYHVSISVPPDPAGETLAQVTRETLAHALRLRFTRSQQTLPLTVLAPAGKPTHATLRPVDGGAQLAFHPGSPAMLLESLHPLFNTPLVDESGLGGFELNLRDVRSLSVVREDLRSQLGLDLKPVKRKVTVVRVEKR